MLRALALCLFLLLVCLLVGSAGIAEPGASRPDRGPLPPAEAFQRLTAPPDLKLEQVLTEPVISQPVSMTFDERGRLWVVQYRQYPYPAGLKILSEDKFLRATYDSVPLPPPHQVRGRDRITIHEDTDSDGTFDKQTTFVDGLNIATSCVPGPGGVWVLNPPYLLFYSDRNRDDVPDGDPVVHLEGFGLEDTHSCVNSLQWGPDGWLYAAQGSTVTGHVKHYGVKEPPVHSMGQLIWRYHPPTHRYEIFAEGGGNAFGIEIDNKGRLYSGHNGGDTRGFHYVQGGYYLKGFSKHGPLSNPFAFGYLPAMKHPPVPRFTHTFVLYEGGSLPSHYHGSLFGVAPLQGRVVRSELTPDGSSFRSRDVDFPLTSTDPWFRPVDIKVGPEGAVYVADFYEAQIGHLRHHEGKIDPTNGRIYRLRARDAALARPVDLARRSTPELVSLLRHAGKWQRRMALRLLGERRDRTALPLLRTMLETGSGQDALEALWALNLSGALDDALALQTLAHPDPHVRLWTVRLLGDDRHVSASLAPRLAELSRSETNVEVRSQLACTARRLPTDTALPIVRGLLGHDEDASDVHLPLLLWWALESKCEKDSERVLALFADASLWRRPLVRQHLLHRQMRRFASTGTRKDLLLCARLLKLAPDAEGSKRLMQGFEEAFHGRPLGDLPGELAEALARLGDTSLALGLRQGKREAVDRALALVADSRADLGERLRIVQALGEVRQPRSVPVLLALLEHAGDEGLRLAALTSLQAYDEPRIAEAALRHYATFTDDARAAAQTLLVSRKPWTLALLEAIDAGRIDRKAIALDTVRRMTIHRDPRIATLVKKHWGEVEGAASAAMQKQVARLAGVLRTGTGSPYRGKKQFAESCARCHTLFGQGGAVGPDLTTYQRADVENLLASIVNPSAEIREGFETVLVSTRDGRVLTGLLADRDNQVIVLRGPDGQSLALRRGDIDELVPQRKSLMPEGLLDSLTDQQVRDLFAYLRSTQPLND